MIPPDVTGAAIDLLRGMLDELESRLANDGAAVGAIGTEAAEAAEERDLADRLAVQLARYRALERGHCQGKRSPIAAAQRRPQAAAKEPRGARSSRKGGTP